MSHPSARELFEYAELLADGAHIIPAAHARHVARCARCAAEVERIRASLAYVARSAALEPTEECTQRILAAARAARKRPSSRTRPVISGLRTGWSITKAFACAATVLLMAGVSFQAVLNQASSSSVSVSRSPVTVLVSQNPVVSPQLVGKVSPEIGELASVLQKTSPKQTPVEWRNRRLALAVREDITAASQALERNPGCERALDMMTLNLTRQADVLKTIYVERTL
jgi:anti-sigma factor RsiW